VIPVPGNSVRRHIILESFQLTEKAYGLNQLHYDLRKLKGHGLLERDGSRYAYSLTSKGFQLALLGFGEAANQRHGAVSKV
jgi:hypothetical protein